MFAIYRDPQTGQFITRRLETVVNSTASVSSFAPNYVTANVELPRSISERWEMTRRRLENNFSRAFVTVTECE